MKQTNSITQILLPELPGATPISQVVLFGFDDHAYPFQNGVLTYLSPGRGREIVLNPGQEGSHDEVLLYYGTVIRIGDTLHMWYIGNYGPIIHINIERKNCVICYATSKDGVHWEKPNLGLVEFNGSRQNNIVDFPVPGLWSTCAIIYEPEDTRPERRFKMSYEATQPNGLIEGCVAFSADGLHWIPSPYNPVNPVFEMSGITKHRGLYFVNGQGPGYDTQSFRRHLMTYCSADFEHWSPCAALGLRRSIELAGPSTVNMSGETEQIHMGAGLSNRGNVILGIYGQWHGHPSGDRRHLHMDLGLVISYDALHYHEPIPGFRIVKAAEQPNSPVDYRPALMQGQGMENMGDETLYWYSLWRGAMGNGVRLASWPLDRLGSLKPYLRSGSQVISSSIRIVEGQARVYVNASGLGEYSKLRVNVLDEGFQPVPGYSNDSAAVIAENGFHVPLHWQAGNLLLPTHGTVRLQVSFEGVRPEDCQLYAIYIES